MTNEQLKKLNDLIDLKLEQIDQYDYPHVRNMADDPDTKESLKEMIITQIKGSAVSVGDAIDRIERAYNPNRIED